jgi:predicted nucleotidyltransferase
MLLKINLVLNIRPIDQQRLLTIFKKVLPASAEIWAYGSRVNGENHEASDLDMVIKTKDGQPLDWGIYNQMLEEIRESNIPILVDIRDWTRMPNSFHQNILKKHHVFFS